MARLQGVGEFDGNQLTIEQRTELLFGPRDEGKSAFDDERHRFECWQLWGRYMVERFGTGWLERRWAYRTYSAPKG